jgi:alpha-methylacyl-CoA racemase
LPNSSSACRGSQGEVQAQVRFTCIIRGIRSAQRDRGTWPELRLRLAAAFLAETQSHWTEVFADLDACVSPVLTLDEAYRGPQLAEAGTYVEAFGMRQPAPAPRLSRTPSEVRSGPPRIGEHSVAVLLEAGLPPGEIGEFLRTGVLRGPEALSESAVSAEPS